MNDFIGNDLCNEIIAQYIDEVKDARGDEFSEKDINLGEGICFDCRSIEFNCKGELLDECKKISD